MKFQFGIEHEISFVNAQGDYADWTNTSFDDLENIVSKLPLYKSDYPQLRVGDAGIKHKRWYVEGFERFDLDGNVIDCPPKGIEIRTTIHDTIEGAVTELTESYEMLVDKSMKAGFTPVDISFNPHQTHFFPNPPLNSFEKRQRSRSPEVQTAHIPMLTQGPDISISSPDLSTDQIIDAGQKFTYYSPALVPFSFCSPFYKSQLWDGLSVRTYHRTGMRPAAMVFIDDQDKMIESSPSLTQKARIPAETGRIEFKAFDTCSDFKHYARLGTLLKGLILDTSLPGRAVVPDKSMHQRTARLGFDDAQIVALATQVLSAAEKSLNHTNDLEYLTVLQDMLTTRRTPSHDMIERYQRCDTIEECLLISADHSSGESRGNI